MHGSRPALGVLPYGGDERSAGGYGGLPAVAVLAGGGEVVRGVGASEGSGDDVVHREPDAGGLGPAVAAHGGVAPKHLEAESLTDGHGVSPRGVVSLRTGIILLPEAVTRNSIYKGGRASLVERPGGGWRKPPGVAGVESLLDPDSSRPTIAHEHGSGEPALRGRPGGGRSGGPVGASCPFVRLLTRESRVVRSRTGPESTERPLRPKPEEALSAR